MEDTINFITSPEGIALAQWVAAFGTALATMMVTLSIHLGGREKRRKQASSINAWTTTKETGTGMEGTLHFRNSGDSPVFDVATRAFSDNGKTVAAWPVRVIEPGKAKMIVNGDSIANPHAGKDTSRLEVFFRDSHGRAWSRRQNGTLKREFFTRKSGIDTYFHWLQLVSENNPSFDDTVLKYIDTDSNTDESLQANEDFD